MTREEAIRLLGGLMFKGKLKEALDMAIKALEKEPRWIPVSERYPEDGQRVLVDYCDEDAGVMLIRFNVNGYRGFKAWMPLPESYKAEIPTGAESEE